jgi:ATP/ADP translocase
VVRRFSASGINISRAQIDALPTLQRGGFLDGFSTALHSVFLCGIVIAVLSFVLALNLREVPLRPRATRAAAPETPVTPAVPRTAPVGTENPETRAKR